MAMNELGIRIFGDANPYRQALNSVVAETKKASASVSSVATASGNAFRQMGNNIKTHFGGVASSVGGFFGKMAQSAQRSFQLIGLHMLGLRTALAGLVGAFAITRFVQGLIRAGSEMEGFGIKLNAAFRGFNLLAEEALKRVIQFARVTPFSTREVIDSFTMLKSVGLEATNSVLEAIGNAAFVFNRGMTDVTSALISMETQTLRNLGVVLDRTGEKAKIMAGGITREVAQTREAIFLGLIGLFHEVFPGAMKAAENTFRGSMANLKSLFEEFSFRLGGNITRQLTPRIKDFIAQFDGLQKSGVLAAIERDISSTVTSVLGWMGDAISSGVKFVALHRDEIKNEVLSVWEGAKTVWQEAKIAFSAIWDLVKSAWDFYKGLPDEVKALGIVGAIFLGPLRAGALMGLAGMLSGANKDIKAQLDEYQKMLGGGQADTGKKTIAQHQADETISAFGLIKSAWNLLPEDLRRWMIGGAVVGGTIAGPAGAIKGGLAGAVGGLAKGGTEAAIRFFQSGSRYDPIIERQAALQGIDPNLVRAIIKQESGFRFDALSPKGAQGLMQLMPGTAKDLGVANAFDPEQNIAGGVRYLAQLFERFNGDIEKTLAAYNFGMGNVERGRELPEETKKYIDNVLEDYQQFTSQRPETFQAATPGRTGVAVDEPGRLIPRAIMEMFAPSLKSVVAETDAEAEALSKRLRGIDLDLQDMAAAWLMFRDKEDQWASNATNLIQQQKTAIDDTIASLNIEVQTAGLFGIELTKQKTLLEGRLAIDKAIADAKSKHIELFGQEVRITEELTAAYSRLARVRALAETTKITLTGISSQRHRVEDLLLEIRAAEAVTQQDRINIELEKRRLEYLRQGIDLRKEEHAALRESTEALAAQETKLGDILSRYEDIRQTIEESFTQAIRNIQTAFSDMWFNLFSGQTKSWKDFARQFAESMLRTISNIQGAIMTAWMENVIERATGMSIKDMIKKASSGIAGSVVSGAEKAKAEAQGVLDRTKATMDAVALEHQKAALAVRDLGAAASGAAFALSNGQIGAPYVQPVVPYAGPTGTVPTATLPEFSVLPANFPLLGTMPASGALGSGGPSASGSGGIVPEETFEQQVQKWMERGPTTPPTMPDPAWEEAQRRMNGGGGLGMLSMFLPLVMGGGKGGGAGMAAGLLGSFLPMLMKLIQPITKTLSESVQQGIGDGLGKSQGDVESASQGFGSSLLGVFSGVLGSIGSWFKSLFASIGQWFSGLFSGAAGGGGGGGGAGIFGGAINAFSGSVGGSIAKSIFNSGIGFGSRPAGVAGPVMQNGGFFSNPLGAIGSWIGGLFGFEKGGITPGRLSPVMAFAGGGYSPGTGMAGIISRPMVTMGENAPSQYEAVVPLPDNRSIPVKLMGEMRGPMVDNRPAFAPAMQQTPDMAEMLSGLGFSVHFNGPIVDPEKSGISRDEVVEIWLEDHSRKGGRTREAIRGDIGL